MKRKMVNRKLIVFFCIPFLLFWHWFDPAAKKNAEGIKAYQAKKFDEAMKDFMSAKSNKPDLAALKNNTASALYEQKKYQEALEEFSKINPEKAGIPKSEFYYNLGNSFFRLNQFDKALENYKKSLIENPEDFDAKKNFELTLKKLEEQKKQDDKKKDDKKQDDKKKDDKKQDDKKQDEKKQNDKNKDDQNQQQQQQQQNKDQKYKDLMNYLNKNEKDQLKNKKRMIGIVKKEKDW